MGGFPGFAPYYVPRNDRIADLIARGGDIAARGALMSGQAWSDFAHDMGQLAANTTAQLMQQRQQRKTDEQLQGILNDPELAQNPQRMLSAFTSALGPQDGLKMATGYLGILGAAQKAQQGEAPTPEQFKASVLAMNQLRKTAPEVFRQQWPNMRGHVLLGAQKYLGYTPPEDPDDPQLGQGMDALESAWTPTKEQAPHTKDVTDPSGATRTFQWDGQQWVAAPGLPAGAAKPKEPGSIEQQYNDLIAAGDTAGAQRLLDNHKKFRESGVTVKMGGMDALYEQTDPKALADSIMKGDTPPDTGRYGRPIGAAVESELAKRGFNLATAVTDWKATQKHVATLNGAQQLRLNQAVNALPEMLDTVEGLAKQWKGGRFPLLNKANLAAAKGGAYGPEAASIANRLDTMIADVTADLGTVYMGGNSPTDHGLELAGKNLRADWDERVLLDAIKLARQNVKIRQNSIANTGVAGASEGNPYAPAAPAAAAGGGGSDEWETIAPGVRRKKARK